MSLPTNFHGEFRLESPLMFDLGDDINPRRSGDSPTEALYCGGMKLLCSINSTPGSYRINSWTVNLSSCAEYALKAWRKLNLGALSDRFLPMRSKSVRISTSELRTDRRKSFVKERSAYEPQAYDYSGASRYIRHPIFRVSYGPSVMESGV